MKTHNPSIGIGYICWLLGVSRQAYYQSFKNEDLKSNKSELVLLEVLEIRKKHPKIGTRKLILMLKNFMYEHAIKMGRDAFFDLLSEHQLLIRKRKRKISTTQSHHWLKKYPNLIKDFTPNAPNQLYVSDITYWKAYDDLYISFITDAFSRKIVGYNLAQTLEAVESVKALEMALKNVEKGINLIHHSDRGAQYCSSKYVKLLQDKSVAISMTQTGDPLDNAIAERINGILKEEYLENYQVKNFQQAKELLDHAVLLYNQERPHMSIGNLTPNDVHKNKLKTRRNWKSYYKKENIVIA